MPGRRLVVLDPLQPLCALDLNVPDDAQFVCSRLAKLAAGTGAPVIVSHRFARRETSTPEQAREAVRGTGGLLDGVRSVCALWNPKEKQAKTICKTLGEPFERGRVLMGGVVKANGRANLRVTTFLRDARGLLVDCSQDVLRTRATDVDLRPALKATIARAATEGEPYTKPAATASTSVGTNCRSTSTASASIGRPTGSARCSTVKNATVSVQTGLCRDGALQPRAADNGHAPKPNAGAGLRAIHALSRSEAKCPVDDEITLESVFK